MKHFKSTAMEFMMNPFLMITNCKPYNSDSGKNKKLLADSTVSNLMLEFLP